MSMPRLCLLLAWALLVPLSASDSEGWSASSDELPLVDLVESPDARYDPGPGDLRPEALLGQLGADFDARFMSVERPEASNATWPWEDFSRRQLALLRGGRQGLPLLLPRGKMPAEVKRLRFRQVLLPDGGRLRARGDRKLRRELRQFLWARSFCPVARTWKDLGPRFWPRWVREGRCLRRRTSCSFPAGMSCKPSRGAHKTLLRWHCMDFAAAHQCRWIRIRYPLVTGCACAC